MARLRRDARGRFLKRGRNAPARRKRRSNRKYHAVRYHKRHYTAKTVGVRKHMSNPRRRRGRRNPVLGGLRIPTVGGLTGQLWAGAIAAGTFLIVLGVTTYVNREAESRLGFMGGPVGNLIGKALIVAGMVMVTRVVLKDSSLRKVALAGAAAPLLVDAVGYVSPAAATWLPLQPGGPVLLPGPVPATVGARFLDAELRASMAQEPEESEVVGYY